MTSWSFKIDMHTITHCMSILLFHLHEENWEILVQRTGRRDNNKCQGITLECCRFKVITKLLTRSLHAAFVTVLLSKQYGTKPERFAPHTIANFLGDWMLWEGPKTNFVVTYYTKVFDVVYKVMIIRRLRKSLAVTSLKGTFSETLYRQPLNIKWKLCVSN
jgi:hypothetical protein